MNFYGVGVKPGSLTPKRGYDILPKCLEYHLWYMGEAKNPVFREIIDKANVGDVVVVKAFNYKSPKKYHIRAIGIIADKEKPENIPEDLKGKYGFSVTWLKHFEKKLHLESDDTFMPKGFLSGMPHNNSRTNSIYQETDKSMIEKIQQIMRYDCVQEWRDFS